MIEDDVAALRQELAALKATQEEHVRQLRALKRIEIAPESGGGSANYSADNVVLKIDGLTPLNKGTFTPVPPPAAPPPANTEEKVAAVIISNSALLAAYYRLAKEILALQQALDGATIQAVCNGDATITVTLTWGEPAP